MFRKKDRWDSDAWERDLDTSSENERRSIRALNSQSISATNGLATLRINTPSNFRPSAETAHQSTLSRETSLDESTIANASNIAPELPLSTFLVPPILSTPDSLSRTPVHSKTSFLTLPTADSSFDTFNMNIDFTNFETKVETFIPYESPPRRITNHDFLFLVDDGPGIDHRAWDTVCDIVSGVTKRLIPLPAKDPTQTLIESPPEAPTISVRFVNSPRNIPRIQNVAQIRNIFNWVTPREISKYHKNHLTVQKPPRANIPPLRSLEYHFWTIYNERLQKNAWVGQAPMTVILFSSSPLGNRPEDMDLFIAKCAEKLNDDQVPLPLVSIMVVQCNADPILHRQLAETRRAIAGEWYTPRSVQKPRPPPTSGNARGAPRRSTLNAYIPEQRKRPQRDWVDIITCMEWERAGGLRAIKGMITEQIGRGALRRRKLQREVAMNYLTHLGKENPPMMTSQVSEGTQKVVETTKVTEYEVSSREHWGREQEEYRRRTVSSQRDRMDIGHGVGNSDNYNHQHHHQRGTASHGIIHTGRIDYFD